jgi:hypothetical protein
MDMADRRDFMGYIGTGAIGGIAGYYVGARELLGIQSEEVVRPSTEDTPSKNTPTEDANTDSDINTFDDFEDSELGWTVTDGENSTITFSTDSIRGSQSLYFRDGAADTKIEREFDTQTQVTQLNFWFKYNSDTDNHFRVVIRNTTGDSLIEIREFGRTVHYKNTNEGGVSAEPVANVSQNAWYKVSISSIDYNSNTLDVTVMDASENLIDSVTGVEFWNPSDAADTITIANSLQVVQGPGGRTDPLWIDDITYRASG